MSIRVTFDSDESTVAFAAKHGLPTPIGNSLDASFHLLEQATKDATVSVVALAALLVGPLTDRLP